MFAQPAATAAICPLLAMYNPRYASPPPMYMNSLNRCSSLRAVAASQFAQTTPRAAR